MRSAVRPAVRLAVKTSLPLALVTLAAAALSPAAAAPPSGPGAWRHDPLWDDGNAELCAYEVEWPRYGHTFTGRALLVLVKEPWDPVQNVKADSSRPSGFDVLKLNHVRDVPTGVYTYHQLASAFLRRDDGRLVKLATSSAEAAASPPRRRWVPGRSRCAATSTAPPTARSLGPTTPWPRTPCRRCCAIGWTRPRVRHRRRRLLVFPTLLDSKLAKLAPRRLHLGRRDAGEVEVPGGRFEAVELRLTGDGEWRSYRFERATPHRLLDFESSDGTHYRMSKCGRVRYWEMHDPGDEEWLPPKLR